MPAGLGTDSACARIASFEGFRADAYQDQRGRWTVGYGYAGPDVHEGLVWTQAEALKNLTARVGHDRHVLEAMVTVPLAEHQWDALTSLVYNIGLGEKGFEGSTLRVKLNAGDYAGAADEFLRWDHVDGVENAGLKNRRTAERALFLAGGLA